MAELPREGTSTRTIEETETTVTDSTPTLQLRLELPRDDRRVVFHDGVIDNEHMNRMKSKCMLNKYGVLSLLIIFSVFRLLHLQKTISFWRKFFLRRR